LDAGINGDVGVRLDDGVDFVGNQIELGKSHYEKNSADSNGNLHDVDLGETGKLL